MYKKNYNSDGPGYDATQPTHERRFGDGGPEPFNPAALDAENLAKIKLQTGQPVIGVHIEIKSFADYEKVLASPAMMDPTIARGLKDESGKPKGGFSARGIFIEHSQDHLDNKQGC